MRLSWSTRLKAIALSILVLSGGGGTSLVDALLYHTRGESLRSATRVAPTDAPRTHASVCILGAAVPVAGTVVTGPAPIRACAIAAAQSSVAPRSASGSGEAPLHNPRAPPALSA